MELIIRTTHNELQDEIDKLDEDMDEIIDTDSHEIKCDDIGEDMIITCGPLFVLEDLGLSVIEGVYCNHNAKNNSYEPDWSLTLIYETTDTQNFNYSDYAYFEQDPPMTALHNYLTATRGH